MKVSRLLLAVTLTLPYAIASADGTGSALVTSASPVDSGKALAAAKSTGLLPAGTPEVQAALLAACRDGKAEAAAKALAAGANPDTNATLAIASERNDLPLAELLIQYGADASLTPAALRSAVKHKNPALLTLLLNAGADPNETDASGVTTLGSALRSGEIELAKLMFGRGGQADDFLEPAMERGDTGLLAALFQSGVSPNTRDAAGNPLIVRAAVDGRADVVKLLIASGADAALPGKEGQAALHFAAVTKNDAILTALLEGGADPNLPFFNPVKEEFFERIDNDLFRKWLKKDVRLTALMLAASRGDTQMLEKLLAKGAKRGLQTKNWGRYPVVFACEAEHIPAAQLLLGRRIAPGEPVHTVTISLSKQKATLYKDDEVVRTCTVSTGRKGYATPSGKYVITDKQKDWISTIYKVSMPFFMRLNCREIGLHAGNCPGYPASHGCIRMPYSEVQKLFATLKIGDAVTIVD